MERISKHISYTEATRSSAAKAANIENKPGVVEIAAMKLLAEKVFEPLRVWYGKPIIINSFYRSSHVNKLVGGSKSSQHVSGQAIDITAGSKEENKKLFDWLNKNVEYDQLINEYNYSWVHVSYRKNNNRNQVLIIK